MPKFDINISKTETTTWTTSIEITANDEDAAREKAEALLADAPALDALMTRQNADWDGGDLDDVDYEIDDVSEA